MSIPTLYGTTGASGLSVVASGQAETLEQLTELNRSLKTDVTIYKGIAAVSFLLASGAGVYVFWQRALMEQRLAAARGEGAVAAYGGATRQFGAQPIQQPPMGAYGYPPPYYR